MIFVNHCGTKPIETDRLILRRFESTDADAMFQNWASDPEVTKFLTWPTHPNVEVSRFVLNDWVKSYENDRYYQWAIVLKEKGTEPIGSICGMDIDDEIGKLQIGYCIGRTWWHKGIMTEALNAVIDFFFDTVGANRVEARHDINNPNSGAVMRKCGMQYEGTLRQADRNNQGICDVAYYSILSTER